MKKMNVGRSLLIVTGMMFTSLFFQNCSIPQSALHRPGSKTNSSNNSAGGLGAFTDAELASKFTTTLQPALQTNCSACHGSFQTPMFAVADATEAVATIRQFGLVNLNDPFNSKFLVKLRSGHNGFPTSTQDAVYAGIVSWDAELNNTPPDVEAPAGTITAPSANASVSGTISLTAMATDNVGVAGVQFQVNNVNVGAEVTSPPYSYSLNTSTLSNGSHSVRAVIRDTSSLTSNTPSVNFTVANINPDTTAPSVSVTAPTANANLSATATFSASASDNVGVVGVQFYIDGNAAGNEDTSSPFSVMVDTRAFTNGVHTITARARDAAGNLRVSSGVAVTINNTVVNPQATYTWINQNILMPKCLSCHGAVGASAGVRFNTYANSKLSVVDGSPNTSSLYTETNSGSMPIGSGSLSTTELNAIRDWILMGAPNN